MLWCASRRSNTGWQLDAFNLATQATERWQARRAIIALPIFVAARGAENPPDRLRAAAASTVYAPAGGQPAPQERLARPPRSAAELDNVLYGDAQNAPGLGYVDASHQRLQSVPGATVLTYYRALGDVVAPIGSPPLAPGVAGRRLLLARPCRPGVMPDWPSCRCRTRTLAKVSRIDITRYGHAMAVPVPKNNGQIGLQPLYSKRRQLSKTDQPGSLSERLAVAHSDWAGYSVFEEAFTLGHAAALNMARRGI